MKSFIRKVIAATEDLDTSVYLNSQTFEEAFDLWLGDVVKALSNVITNFSRFDYSVSAGVICLNEKRLEENNKDFLIQVANFVKQVDRIFARKALQYSKICKKFNQPKDLKSKLELQTEGKKYLTLLETALTLVNKFSKDRIREAKKRKVYSLPFYEIVFSRIDIFSNLDRDSFIDLLKEHGEV
jgi:hypothetical protein